MTASGAIAAVASAAMAHQLMPCEPVWLASMTGMVLASVEVSRAAKKYSFQHSTSARMKYSAPWLGPFMDAPNARADRASRTADPPPGCTTT